MTPAALKFSKFKSLKAVHDIAMSDPNLVKYRDRAGRTSLHLAVLSGNIQMTDLLLKMKSDTRLRDCDGCSPVHLAARSNNVEALVLLFKFGAELTARVPSTGWSPLHEAAYYGNIEVTQKLLELGVPVHPRCHRQRTPAELARTRGHDQVTELIEGWTKKINGRVRQAIPEQRFLHGQIDRNQASDMCLQAGEGAFLVRESRRRPGDLVLTVNFSGKIFNYEVRNGDHLWFSIDEGPMFESIVLLIDYYMKNADGLPSKLTHPVEPVDEARHTLKKLQIAQNPVSGPGPGGQHSGHPMGGGHPGGPMGGPHGGGPMNGSTILPPMHGNGRHLPHTDVPSRRAQPTPPPTHNPNSHQATNYDPNEFKGAEAPHIPYEQLEMTDQLGEGEFGSVLRGVWHPGQNIPPRHVAIKTLRPESLVNGEKEFVREAAVMSRLNHPSIVTLYGVCRENRSGMLMLVQELLNVGSALEFILSHAKEVKAQP